jgi:prepilin-type N-terminal cleavage/methylation domain-containing protein
MDQKMKRRVQRGFTLIEVMLVVVIIGIMSSIAIPLYTRATAKAYRAEAQITLSKLEIYFKNLYENQGNYDSTAVLKSTADIMPDPGNTVPVGQGVDWKAVSGHGWDDIPFPPQGDIRMRYQYTVAGSGSAETVTLQACGNFPGFGAPTTIWPNGAACNYVYSELMQGTSIATANITETPTF